MKILDSNTPPSLRNEPCKSTGDNSSQFEPNKSLFTGQSFCLLWIFRGHVRTDIFENISKIGFGRLWGQTKVEYRQLRRELKNKAAFTVEKMHLRKRQVGASPASGCFLLKPPFLVSKRSL
jgi:hypothetical protein